MRSISLYFERADDAADMLNNSTFLSMIRDNEIVVLYDSHYNELSIKFNEPFDQRVLQAVFDLAMYYANFN